MSGGILNHPDLYDEDTTDDRPRLRVSNGFDYLNLSPLLAPLTSGETFDSITAVNVSARCNWLRYDNAGVFQFLLKIEYTSLTSWTVTKLDYIPQFLLLENGNFLLLEHGDKIFLEG